LRKGKKETTQEKPVVNGPISLKKLAAYLGLNPATVSVVLNDISGRSIPQATRERIKAAAKELNYQPSHLARSLRNRRTLTIGILVPELGDGYHTQVLSGIGDQLMEAGYFYFTAQHRHRKDLVERYGHMLLNRGCEALITIDTALEHSFAVPVVAVAGHRPLGGVTNLMLDHRRAAELSLTHLYSLGHRRMVFMRGQPFSSDSDDRWRSIVQVTREMGIMIEPNNVVQLDRDINTPELGYPVMQHVLAARARFTAVVAFNDMSAIGAIRALQDFGLRVPADVSVIGFDDIHAAAFNNPRLTTIRQPLRQMGRTAAQCVLNRLHRSEAFREQILIEPELVIRDSTGANKSSESTASRKKNRTGHKADDSVVHGG
jgi:DNA-binding LacI/PurR family transcriptional regulator